MQAFHTWTYVSTFRSWIQVLGGSRDRLFMSYVAVPDAAVAVMHSLNAAYSYSWQELSSWGAVLLDVAGQNTSILYCFSCRV